jgi:cysteine desulfurase
VNLAGLPVDLMSLTAHKFYGPKGVGALFIADRPGVGVEPLMHGGGQERRLRPGTLPVHQIIGLGAAASLAADRMQDDLDRMRQLRERLLAGLRRVSGLRLNGPEASGYPGIVNVSAEGVDGESLLLAMDPVCVARGSACNAASGEASYVLRALGLDDVLAGAAIRFSFGRFSSESDIDTAIERYIDAVRHLRRLAPGQDDS